MSIEVGPAPVTPLPWHSNDGATHDCILDAAGEFVCDTTYGSDRDAIMHRVNNWDALWERKCELEGKVEALNVLLDLADIAQASGSSHGKR